MWVAIQIMNEDNVNEAPISGSIDLCEAEKTDLRSARGCLEKVSKD